MKNAGNEYQGVKYQASFDVEEGNKLILVPNINPKLIRIL